MAAASMATYRLGSAPPEGKSADEETRTGTRKRTRKAEARRRAALLALAALPLAGCSAPPTVLEAVEPAANPYRLPYLPKDPLPGSVLTSAPSWTHAQLIRRTDGLVGAKGADLVSVEGDELRLEGAKKHVQVLERFFADRLARKGQEVEVDAELLRVLPSELPRTRRLDAQSDGSGLAVLAGPSGWRAGRRLLAPRVTVADGEPGVVEVWERAPVTRTKVRGGHQVGEPASAATVRSGVRLRLLPALAADDLLVLALDLEVGVESVGPIAVRVDSGTDQEVVSLPRVRRLLGSGRVALRAGETLWWVLPDAGTGDVLVLELSWRRP